MNEPLRSETVRIALLAFLSPRQSLSFDLPTLLFRLNRSGQIDFKLQPDDLTKAVAFLEGKEYIKHTVSALGSTRFYQATSAGVLAHERGTLEENQP